MTRRARAAGTLCGAIPSIRRAVRGSTALACLAIFAGLLAADPAGAENAWVKDELTLGVRTGPGSQYRIKGWVKTGESFTVLDRRDEWVQVRTSEHGDGWVEGNYLSAEPPAAVRLAQTQAETAQFRGQFSSLSDRVKQLEAQNGELTAADTSQREEIETLTRENLELRAGARWPEWITGAGILSVGMLMGAILQSVNGRRSRPRIRI